MCGILGFIGNIPASYQEEAFDFLKHLFIQSNVRGKDATGFAAIHSNSDAPLVTEKRPIPSDKFVAACARFKALRSAMPHIFIGHTRAATSGKPNRGRNNHPFNSQQYSLVHNGHISGWDDLVKKNNIKMRTETDSEVILHLISEKNYIFDGIQHMTDTVDKNSKIATAILQHKGSHRLFLFRNSNPISTVTIPAWESIFFASTSGIIEDAMKALYGLTAYADKKKAYGMDINAVPEWKAYELGFDEKDGKVKLYSEVEISQPKIGLKVATSSQSTTKPSCPTPPPAAEGYKNGQAAASAPIGNSATETALRGMPDSHRKAISGISDAIGEFSAVLASIASNPHMTDAELTAYRRWANNGRI